MTPGLMTTSQAAARAGKSVQHFRVWAARAGLQPAARVRVGRSTCALWDREQLLDTLDGQRMTPV